MHSELMARPPFRNCAAVDPHVTAAAIVDSFACFAALRAPLATAFTLAMQVASVDFDDPLYLAGLAAARDIDAGIGDGMDNHYHNSQHYCEVLLCALCVTDLAKLEPRERALVLLAAILHDFHHDGKANGQPYRLELLAVEKALPYLAKAGVRPAEQRQIAALILATETATGAPLARQCYARHFSGDAAAVGAPSHPEFELLLSQPRVALQAVLLAEADVLPSVGLTVEHADLTSARLASEWQISLGPQSKIDFIDAFLERLLVATYFAPNIRRVRQAFAGRG